MSTVSLPPEIRQLPIADRLDLVNQIWDSIVEDDKAEQTAWEPTPAQKAELDRRLEMRKKYPGRSSDWETVKKRILGDTIS